MQNRGRSATFLRHVIALANHIFVVESQLTATTTPGTQAVPSVCPGPYQL